MTEPTTAGREARSWIAIASGASGDHLTTAEAAMINALLGIGCALLDLTTAIREQTAAEYERQAIVP